VVLSLGHKVIKRTWVKWNTFTLKPNKCAYTKHIRIVFHYCYMFRHVGVPSAGISYSRFKTICWNLTDCIRDADNMQNSTAKLKVQCFYTHKFVVSIIHCKSIIHIQGWAKVGLQLWVREIQSLFLYYYLFIILLFICIICLLICLIINNIISYPYLWQ
jgi:hypothetical protein